MKQHQAPIPVHGLLRLAQVLSMIPISKSAWWEGCRTGRYPKPVKLGPRTTVWQGKDIAAFTKALAVRERIMSNLLQTFWDILTDKGLIPAEIMGDGKLHRCPTQTKPHKQNGAYIAHVDIPATLWWYNWENGEQGTFTEAVEKPLSPAEKDVLQRRQNDIRRQREEECARRYETAAKQAQNMLNISFPGSSEHAYLRRKGVPAVTEVRQDRNGMLLIPVRDISGKVQSLQYIAPDGTKRFLVDGKVRGGHFVLPGNPEKPLVLCEGYATGASIHLAVNCTVYVTFSANNLPVVANLVRHTFPDASIIICGDNDEAGHGKGQEAAQTAQARLVLPTFSTRAGKDFNDLHQSEGLQEIRRQLEASEHTGGSPALVSLNMGEFLSMSIPERGYLLSPVLPVQGIGILYAPRGIGKTFAALSIAVAVASGGAVFNWRAPMPKRTLYVDGEIPATSMQNRLSALVNGMSVPQHTLKNMALITPDLQP